MPWCIRCGTGLSQHELVGTDSYRELTHTSVYLALPIVERPGEHFLVWTTTPWTLPANVALAVHPELEYVKVRQGDERLLPLAAHDRLPEGRLRGGRAAARLELVGLTLPQPVRGARRPSTASSTRSSPGRRSARKRAPASSTSRPGCGAEDFELSQGARPAVITPIDEAGVYVDGFGELSGADDPRDEPGHLREPAREGPALLDSRSTSTATRAAGAAARSWCSAWPTSGSSAPTRSAR